MKFSKEIIAQASSAKNAGELLALAEQNGIEMTSDQATSYYSQLNSQGELSDNDLDNVAGGCFVDGRQEVVSVLDDSHPLCPDCGTELVYYVGITPDDGDIFDSYICTNCCKFFRRYQSDGVWTRGG